MRQLPLDFEMITNPLGPPPVVRAALAAFDPTTPADPEWLTLREVLATQLNIDVGQVWAGEGLLREVIRALVRERQRALVFTPSPPAYVDAVLDAGGEAVEVRAVPQTGWAWDVRELRGSLRGLGAACAIIGSPNDPTGACLMPEKIGRLARTLAPAPLLVDESCLPFVEDVEESASLLAEHENLVLFRSLQRAYGLGSLALEYVAGSAALVERLRVATTRTPPSPTASAAQLAGRVSLEQGQLHAAQGRRAAREGGAVLRGGCADLGLSVASSPRASYVLVRAGPKGRATETRQALLEVGFDVLDCTPMGLPGYVRIAARHLAMCRELVGALENLSDSRSE